MPSVRKAGTISVDRYGMSEMSAWGDAGDAVESDSLPLLSGRESLSLNPRAGGGGGAGGAGGRRSAAGVISSPGRPRRAPMMAVSRRPAAWRRAARTAGAGLAAAPTL